VIGCDARHIHQVLCEALSVDCELLLAGDAPCRNTMTRIRTEFLVPESSPEQTAISHIENCFLSGEDWYVSAILNDVLLFACIAAFYTGIVIAAAVLFGSS
jgi:hypothetical protein